MSEECVLSALRLWVSDTRARATFSERKSHALSDAFSDFLARIPATDMSNHNRLTDTAGQAVAYGYLNERLKEIPNGEFDNFLDKLVLIDLFHAAACIEKDSAATTELLASVNGLGKQIYEKWRRSLPESTIREKIEDLPSRLFEKSGRGLNVGRPMLQSYYGRSTLVRWLHLVLENSLIDARRRHRAVPDNTGEIIASATAPEEDRSATADLGNLKLALKRAFREMLLKLVHEGRSQSQLSFAYLKYVKGLSNTDIAERLKVGKSRVTELSTEVGKKLLHDVNGLFESASPSAVEMNRRQMQLLEECLHDMLRGDDGGMEFDDLIENTVHGLASKEQV